MTARVLFALAVALAVAPAGGRADDGIPEKALDALKAASVYVKVDGKDGAATGSGFLIQTAGDVGYVATNRHVIAGALGRGAAKCSAVFWSGTPRQQVLTATVVAADADADLAVLKVTAKGLPAPLDLSAPAKTRETMTVYTFGFPLGDRLSGPGVSPSVTIGKGTVGRLVTDAAGRLDRVQIDGELNPGNSGGPVVDTSGRLVGVAVSKVVGTKIGFAIPPGELAAVLKGRAGPVMARTAVVDTSGAEVLAEVPVADPLAALKSVEVRFVRAEPAAAPAEPDKDGRWAALPAAGAAAVKIDAGKGVAKVKLTAPEKKPVGYLLQSVYTTADGVTTATRPFPVTIDFGKSGTVKLEAAPPWLTITSREGGFTVDLPAKPIIDKAERRKTSLGTLSRVVLGTATDNGVYMVFRLELPEGLPAGSEARILDFQRDDFAEMWNGKVTSEKKVKAQGNPGRDFTIRGKLEDRPATIRVRQYMIGRAIYALAVLSPPDSDLPEDAGRFLGSLALGEAKTRASGTPEPELKGMPLKGWDVAIDPDGDCKFTPTDKGVTIEVLGKLHDLFYDGGATNAPRVFREVEGDFMATVKVVGEFKPGPKSTNPKSVPFHGDGFLLWSDSDNNIRFERFSWMRAGKFTTGALFEEREGGYGGAAHTELFPLADCYLRVQRTGSRIVGGVSPDGKKWRMLKPLDTVWPTKLKLGLVAISTSSQPFVVQFEEFELKLKP